MMLTCNDSESESEDDMTVGVTADSELQKYREDQKFRSEILHFGEKLIVFRNWHLLFVQCYACQPHLHHVRDCSARPVIL